MAKKQRKQTPKDLPGSLYQRNSRWWWKVRLPGEDITKAHPLKPVGCRYATTDYAVAVECARQMLQQHLFKKDAPFQGEVHIIPDLVRAYMVFAKEYMWTLRGKPHERSLTFQGNGLHGKGNRTKDLDFFNKSYSTAITKYLAPFSIVMLICCRQSTI